jgi:hypothetical protein
MSRYEITSPTLNVGFTLSERNGLLRDIFSLYSKITGTNSQLVRRQKKWSGCGV